MPSPARTPSAAVQVVASRLGLSLKASRTAYDGLLPLALGQIGLSHVDLMSAGSADPFARFKVAIGAPEWLRSAAIVCLGRLDATHQDVDAAAVVQAILAEEPDPAVLESAFEAQAHLTLPIPVALAQRGLRHPSAGVRAKALQAWGASRDELEDDVVERALADSELAVRITLMTIAGMPAIGACSSGCAPTPMRSFAPTR